MTDTKIRDALAKRYGKPSLQEAMAARYGKPAAPVSTSSGNEDTEGPFAIMRPSRPASAPNIGDALVAMQPEKVAEFAGEAGSLVEKSAFQMGRSALNTIPEAAASLVELPAKGAKAFLQAAEPGMRRLGIVPDALPSAAYQQAVEEYRPMGAEDAAEAIRGQKAPPIAGMEGGIADKVGAGVGYAAQAVLVPGSVGAKLAFGATEAAASGFVTNLEVAKAEGASPQEALGAALAGAGIQAAASTLPLHKALTGLEKASGGLVGKALTDAIVFGGAGAGQSALNDVVMEHATGKDREILKNAAEAGMLGVLTGPIVTALSVAAMAGAKGAKPEAAKGEPEPASAPVKPEEAPYVRGDDMPPDAGLGQFRAKDQPEAPFARGDDTAPDAGLDRFKSPKEAEAAVKAKRKQTETPEFKKWFGGSKVVDESGEPKVMYHGTASDFSTFDIAKLGPKQEGFWFTPIQREASEYSEAASRSNTSGGARVLPVHLSIKNPAPLKVWNDTARDVHQEGFKAQGPEVRRRLIEAGYDGLRNDDMWVAFYPEQIKSATGNSGKFDPNNPDIRDAPAATPEPAPVDTAPAEAGEAGKTGAKMPHEMSRGEFEFEYHRESKTQRYPVLDKPIGRKILEPLFHESSHFRNSIEWTVEDINQAIRDLKGRRQNKGTRAGIEYLGKIAPSSETMRRSIVERAISEGKPVPPEVLADYPDLAAKIKPNSEPKQPPATSEPVAEPVVPKVEPAKQPWEMTRAEFEDASLFHGTSKASGKKIVKDQAFDLSKFGTGADKNFVKGKVGAFGIGQGAGFYGKGVYLTSSENLAKIYAEARRSGEGSVVRALLSKELFDASDRNKVMSDLKPWWIQKVHNTREAKGLAPYKGDLAEAFDVEVGSSDSGFAGAVNEYAAAKGYPGVKFSSSEIVLSDPSVVRLVTDADHKTIVERALSEGKPVPPEVLADYPDLAAKIKPNSEVKQITAASEPVAEPVAPKVEPAKPPSEPVGERTTSIKNRKMAEDAARMGEPEAERGPEITDQDALDVAKERIAKNPNYVRELVADLSVSERAPSKYESAALGVERRRIENEREAAFKAYTEAKTDAERAAADARSVALQEEFTRLYDVTRLEGTKSGQTLQARKAELASDFTLARMEYEVQKAGGGEPLTKAEREEVRTVYEEYRKARDTIAMILEEQARTQAEAESTKGFTILREKARTRPRRNTTRVEQYIHSKAEEARARLRSGTVARELGGVFSDAAWIGADLIAKGIRKFEAWVVEMRKELNLSDDEFKKVYAESVRAHSQAGISAVRDRAAERFKSGRGLGRYPEQIARRVIESGVKQRDAVIDAVHEQLREIDPTITREQTRDAISGYGQSTSLRQDETSRILRDIKGQAQQLAKIEALEKKLAPLRTGPERRDPSAEERSLIKRVNKLKKGLDIRTIDPENALKTALESKKHRLENQIEDLQHAIDTREPITRDGKPVPGDAETAALEKQRDALKAEYESLFGKDGPTDVERAQKAIKSLEESVAEYERRIREHDIARKSEKQGPPTEEVSKLDKQRNALAARRDALSSELREMRRLAEKGPKPSKEEVSVKAAITRANNRTANLYERIWYEDFAPRERKEVTETPELLEARTRQREAVLQLERAKKRKEWEQRGNVGKILHTVKETVGFVTDIRTSLDLPPILRQGGFFLFTRPVLSSKAFVDSLPAILSKKNADRIQTQIESHPLYKKLQNAGLQFTGYGDTLSPQEENIRSMLSQKTPLVGHTQRGFVAMLNLQRISVAEAMVNAIPHTPTKADLQSVAEMVNHGTGRGSFKNRKWDAGLELARFPLFAPRLYLSRINLLSGSALRHATPEVRKIIAKDYARFAAGISAIGVLAYLSGNEDAFDWRSTDALQLKIGDTRVDLTAQMRQYYTLLGRLATHQKSVEGKVTDIGDKEIISDFAWNKVTPPISAYVDLRNAFEDKPSRSGTIDTPTRALLKSLAPLAPMDVVNAIKSEGVPTGIAISLAALLGAGVNTYKRKQEIPSHVQDLIKKLRAAGQDERANELYNRFR